MLKQIVSRPRMTLAVLMGLVAGILSPADWHVITRWLVGWNTGCWTYLALMAGLMSLADHGHLRRLALAQAQSAAVVLGLVVASALASLAAIVAELTWVRQAALNSAAPHLLLAAMTVLGAWLLLPTVFTFSYASLYHRSSPGHGLRFPDEDPGFQPHYSDFLYFACTIAVAAQTSDVTVCSRPMRRLVLLQSVLSFAFNTAILALTVNLAAGLL
jgi:uncharacterized membrane protein